jgi:hypothetical protein
MTPADWQRAHEYTQECWRGDEAESKRKAVRAAQDRERDERVARALLADADRAELEALTRQIQRGSLEAMTRHLEVIARQHRLTIVWRAGVFYALPLARRVMCPKPTSAAEYAGGLHELAHGILGMCPGTSPHQLRRDVVDGQTHLRCQACEVAAWELAMRLSPIWTREMHRELQTCLPTYARTPAPAVMQSRMAQTVSSRAFAERQQRRVAHEIRVQQQAEVMRQIERDDRRLRLWRYER